MIESPKSDRPETNGPDRDPYGDGLPELPPNVPPGFLGEKGGMRLQEVDGDGPHGLNAGVIQESTVQTTVIIIALAYIFFFPAAYVILWRTNKLNSRQKSIATVAMTVGVIYFTGRILGWF